MWSTKVIYIVFPIKILYPSSLHYRHILQQKHPENVGNYPKTVGQILIKLTQLAPAYGL